jgi:hypothetical protein
MSSTSFGPVRQINAGALDTGYAEAGLAGAKSGTPATGRNCHDRCEPH